MGSQPAPYPLCQSTAFPNVSFQSGATHVARRRERPPEDGGAERLGGRPLPLREDALVRELGLGAVGRHVEQLVEGDEAVEGLLAHVSGRGVLTSVLAFGDFAVEAHLLGNYLQD